MITIINSPIIFDINRIMNICAEHGYLIDYNNAESIWNVVSHYYGTYWLGLDGLSDTKILHLILDHGIVSES